MSINNFGRLGHIYRAGTTAGPEVQSLIQVWMDPDGTHHHVTKLAGAGVGTSLNENANNNKQAYNRCIVNGKYVYWLQANVIYSWNIDTNINTTSHTLPSGSNGNLRGLNTGIYEVLISGVPHLATVHCPNDTTVRAAIYNVATSGWTNRSTWTPINFNVREASGCFISEIMYGNKIYACGNHTYFIYDPQTDTYIDGNWPSDSVGPYDWCPFQGKLYGTGKKLSNGSIQIYEMNHGPQLVAQTQAYGVAREETLEGRNCLFTDRENLYSIFYSSGSPNSGFGIYKFGMVSGVMSFIGDVSSTIQVSAALAKNNSDVNTTYRSRCTAFVNQLADPDGKESIVFFFDRGGGTGNHLLLGVPQYYEQEVWDTPTSNFRYDEANTAVISGVTTTVGRVGDSSAPALSTAYQLSYSMTKNGGGERTYNWDEAPEPRVQVTAINTSGTIVQISYKIITNAANFSDGTDCAVLFKYDANMHSPRANCYLQNSSHGSIVGNRKIVVAASQYTDYYVEWNAGQDGFSGRYKAAIVPFIANTGTT